MANNCFYKMKVTGEPNNIREFIKVIQYDHIRKMSRVFEANVEDEESIDEGFVHISGDCAWSVSSCMMEGYGSYVGDSIEEHREELSKLQEEYNNLGNELISKAFYNKKKKDLELFENSSLIRESYILNLTIEVQNGNVLIDDCVDYEEFYFDPEDKDDTEEQKKEKEEEIKEAIEKIRQFDPDFTKDKIVYDESMSFGGYGDWDFDEWQDTKENKDITKEVL